jgi:hypothetical protein
VHEVVAQAAEQRVVGVLRASQRVAEAVHGDERERGEVDRPC